MRFVPLLLAALALAGCASAPSKAPTPAAAPVAAAASAPTVVAATDPPTQVCHRETPLGSTIVKTVCETVRTDAQIRQDQDNMRSAVRAQTTHH